MRSAFFVTIWLFGGCASALNPIQDMRQGAPAWYEARKEEIRGEGYPQIANIPVLAGAVRPGQGLARSRENTLSALALLRSDPRMIVPSETAEEMRAWSQELQFLLESQVPQVEFMTDADVAALRARFDTARGRL